MKKYDYYITIDKKDLSVGLLVTFAGNFPQFTDRWFLPVRKKLFYMISERLFEIKYLFEVKYMGDSDD